MAKQRIINKLLTRACCYSISTVLTKSIRESMYLLFPEYKRKQIDKFIKNNINNFSTNPDYVPENSITIFSCDKIESELKLTKLRRITENGGYLNYYG